MMAGAKLAIAALALLATGPPPSFPPARPLVPFVPGPGKHCYWQMRDRAEAWERGGIVPGDTLPVIHFVDDAFDSWSDDQTHQIEVSVGNPAKRVPARAWVGSAEAQRPAMMGFDLDAEMRTLIGGAASLQVWKKGKPVYNVLLARTPTSAELAACVGAPRDPDLDDEE